MRADAIFTDSALPAQIAMLQVAGAVLASALLSRALLWSLGRLLRSPSRASSDEDTLRPTMSAPGDHVSSQVRFSLMSFVGLCTARFMIPEVADFRPVSEQVVLALQVSTIFAFSWLLLQAGRGIRKWLDDHFDISMPDNFRSRRVRTQIAFIERIFDLVVVVVTVAIVLRQFESGRQLSTTLLASAGVASLVIGFAAQKTIANLLAGFQIAFTSPIRIDDAVVVEGEWGWIEEISLTYVVVRVWDRRRLILPITYFVEKPFQNWTRKSGQILGSVFLEVAHHTPFEPLNEELNRLLDNNPLWDGDARVLQVVEMRERCVQLRALMTARSSPECWDLRCAIRRGLIEYLVRTHPECLPTTRLSLVDRALEAPVSTARRPPTESWAFVREPASSPYHEG